MAKKSKKRLRLKRSVRKTLGTLFLVSALIVAAIPAENLQAVQGVSEQPSITTSAANIPVVTNSDKIYSTGDGVFQFAYVPVAQGSSVMVAVILGYNGGRLVNGELTIPDTVDVYASYKDNMGTNNGNVAVGKSGNFLFYLSYEHPEGDLVPVLKDGEPVYDEETGEQLFETITCTHMEYLPCLYSEKEKWEALELDQMYYLNQDKYVRTTDALYQRITGAEVRYIGNQYLTYDASKGTWNVSGSITSGSQGVFAQQGTNIRSLTVGPNLSGIGDYAFYGCGVLKSITLSNGLDTIGCYAFAECHNMTTVNIDIGSRITSIGHHAFYNCQSLESFTVPLNVREIGDECFKGCMDLRNIELCGNGEKPSLNALGQGVFQNCSSLTEVEFPGTFSNNSYPIDIAMFKGCTSLQKIRANHASLDFCTTDGDLSFADFKAMVPTEFYFEAVNLSKLHERATENFIAFSYLGEDTYEITVDTGDGKKAVYRVNSNNQLIYIHLDEGITDVELPAHIGPYGISIISSGTFRDNCQLKEITIPATVIGIEAEAFQGCHNLTNVIFSNAAGIQSVGTNAFQTQVVKSHQANCEDKPSELQCTADSHLVQQPILHFVGTISPNAVFEYAMDPESDIAAGAQTKGSYIIYYSGWPQNLAVQYNPDTDRNELIDYPTFANATAYSPGTGAIAADQPENGYIYCTQDYYNAANNAYDKYISNAADKTGDESNFIDAVTTINLPQGIEGIRAGLFAKKEAEERPGVTKTITAYSIKKVKGGKEDASGKIKGGDFDSCKNLTAVTFVGETTTIGDYAFHGCENLTYVSLPTTLEKMGRRPFDDCSSLTNVELAGNPYMTCENSIIYQLDQAGNRYKVIEYLQGRTAGVVDANEMSQVTELAPEAFMNTNVSSVDFRSSSLKEVSEKAFADTPRLFAVYLPGTCRSIASEAFGRDSALQYLEVPNSVDYIDNTAFTPATIAGGLTFYCQEDSTAERFAKNNGIHITNKPDDPVYYTVYFWDYDGTLLKTQENVMEGTDATPPEDPQREGYVFSAWVPDYHGVTDNLQVTAQYVAEDPDAKKVTVTFLDYDDTVLKQVRVLPGESAEPPVNPTREGYYFIGWRNSYENVTADVIIYAQYERSDPDSTQHMVRFIDYDDTVLYTQKVEDGESAVPPQDPTREGYVFTGWRPKPVNVTADMDTYAQYEKSGDASITPPPMPTATPSVTPDPSAEPSAAPSGSPSATPTTTPGTSEAPTTTPTGAPSTSVPNAKLYTLTVKNGSGSGSYAAGSQPVVIANDPSSGQEFSHWTVSPEKTVLASKVLSATVVTMPEENVTITAHYKAKTNASTGTGNSSSNNRNDTSNSSTVTPNRGQSVNKQGSTVVIDKNGLSNTGVVSVAIKGSSDNFTVKISESDAATEAALRALIAEYGNDLSNIRYFPMDISLYDSTGTNKITDTTGLSVSITLPLPDSMITYAGNNKVAGVVNDKLDKLTPKFTTIDGVACVTFTAEHFSPYLIYTDISKLTAGSVADSTPKTGDGIHPKWFLSIGLACMSFLMFMKKDNRKKEKVRVRSQRR